MENKIDNGLNDPFQELTEILKLYGIERPIFLPNKKQQEILNAQNALNQSKQRDLLGQGYNYVSKDSLKKEADKQFDPKYWHKGNVPKEKVKDYKVVFRNAVTETLKITEEMYKSLLTDMGLNTNLRTLPYEGLIHGIDGEDHVSIRQSEILYIGKI